MPDSWAQTGNRRRHGAFRYPDRVGYLASMAYCSGSPRPPRSFRSQASANAATRRAGGYSRSYGPRIQKSGRGRLPTRLATLVRWTCRRLALKLMTKARNLCTAPHIMKKMTDIDDFDPRLIGE